MPHPPATPDTGLYQVTGHAFLNGAYDELLQVVQPPQSHHGDRIGRPIAPYLAQIPVKGKITVQRGVPASVREKVAGQAALEEPQIWALASKAGTGLRMA
jgi:hypothetical protein